MGTKGSKRTGQSDAAAARLLTKLDGLDGISSKKMFGGHGVFHDGTMFGMVDSAGRVFFKVADGNRARYEAAGSERHSRMPYYAVPDAVMADSDTLQEWAGASIEVTKR